MPYLFFLGPIPLPITPSALTIKTPSMNKTVTLVNEGEINIPKRSGLREISFEFLLPQVQKYPFANYQLGSYTASVMIPLLNMWKDTCIPFRFIVTRMSPSGGILYFTYIKCVIEDFDYNEDAEAHGLDVMCSINLKEYIDYGTKTLDVKEAQNQQDNTTQQATLTQTRPSKQVPSTVTGTTPTEAAAKAGNPNNWRSIAINNDFAVPSTSTLDPVGGVDSLGDLIGQTSTSTSTATSTATSNVFSLEGLKNLGSGALYNLQEGGKSLMDAFNISSESFNVSESRPFDIREIYGW